jgi:ABC-2 type transport system ATP-binding protein
MKRDVLEIEVDKSVEALEVLYKEGVEAAIFGSLIHATVESAETAMPVIKTLVEQSGIVVRKIEKIVPSLEDVFVTLIEVS